MGEGKRGRERERDGEKEGCALTVGIHERSPPGGLACERNALLVAFHAVPSSLFFVQPSHLSPHIFHRA